MEQKSRNSLRQSGSSTVFRKPIAGRGAGAELVRNDHKSNIFDLEKIKNNEKFDIFWQCINEDKNNAALSPAVWNIYELTKDPNDPDSLPDTSSAVIGKDRKLCQVFQEPHKIKIKSREINDLTLLELAIYIYYSPSTSILS